MDPPASLDEAIQSAIGRKLRESWQEVVNEKVPDKFRDLLDQLKRSEGPDQENGGREN
ncbi:NepR family anti-sigma factor [Hyphomicrobium sp.]|uniref:NepR family anti-sigma factor n=1 Tax=Hyphomicrobium sp. TaxID=82 RepID=UPI002FE120A3